MKCPGQRRAGRNFGKTALADFYAPRFWNNANRMAASLAVLAVLLTVAGCSKNSSGKFQVSGEVTLEGVPLDKGGIRFSSLSGEKITSGAMIRDGQYVIPAEKGLPAGTYRVSINSADEAAPKIIAYGTPVAPNRIPEEYNLKSNKTIEVTASGENNFLFHIVNAKSKPK